jgi:predicted nucleic acid-binding protein
MTLLADSNVIVAAIVGDADSHGPLVAELVRRVEARGEQLRVTEGVFVAVVWVLGRRYAMDPPEIATALVALLDSSVFRSWDPPLVLDALRIVTEDPRLDIVDALLAARSLAGEGSVVTLDRRLARHLGTHPPSTSF